MTAYYNENDLKAAAWLRELIRRDLIAPGDVDERSIADVRPEDLAGYTQCHFFAGIGGWSYALRLAGWPDDRPVWTGSCPCQPFSSAGKRAGFDDKRHLWPEWHRLIRECGPGVVFGEQVASRDGYGWLDTVWTDMEADGYAFAPVVLPACSVGAPHIRHRLWFVGVADAEYAEQSRREGRSVNRGRHPRGDAEQGTGFGGSVPAIGVVNANSDGPSTRRRAAEADGHGNPAHTAGWDGLAWLDCLDGVQRPAPPQPAFQPLAHGVPARVVRLRGYGNAIVPQVAAEFIGAFIETEVANER